MVTFRLTWPLIPSHRALKRRNNRSQGGRETTILVQVRQSENSMPVGVRKTQLQILAPLLSYDHFEALFFYPINNENNIFL